MKRSANYKTKQLEAVLDYVISHRDTHVTAAQIVEYFAKGVAPIGKTTIYRNLDKLIESGKVRRYITDGGTGACYQYAEDENCHSHFHMKCEDCGELLHLECEELNNLEHHVLSKYAFKINMFKTVFYGTCNTCFSKI